MKKIAVILMVCLALVGVAQAQRILIDVGLTPSAGNWNNFSSAPSWGINGGDVYQSEATSVISSTGAVVPGAAIGVMNMDDCRADSGTTGLGITYNGITYPDTATGDIAQNVDSVSGTGAGPAGYATKVIISGLSAGNYNVTLYCGRTSGTRTGWFAINGGAAQLIDAVAQNNTTETFANCATANLDGLSNAIEVQFWGDSASGGYADLNVVDLAPAPEPATMGLLAIGALMALKRRRA